LKNDLKRTLAPGNKHGKKTIQKKNGHGFTINLKSTLVNFPGIKIRRFQLL